MSPYNLTGRLEFEQDGREVVVKGGLAAEP